MGIGKLLMCKGLRDKKAGGDMDLCHPSTEAKAGALVAGFIGTDRVGDDAARGLGQYRDGALISHARTA